MTQQVNRKDQHVGLANQQYQASSGPDLEAVRFVHQAFAELDVADVSAATQVAGLDFSTPFFINAITGGSLQTIKINQRLAILARETGLALATGSVSIAMKDPEAAASFKVIRQENPDGLVFANLGAHHGLENAKRAVDLLEANALQIHVNVPQEIIMPEGDRAFRGWLDNVETIAAHLSVPVVVKEVGFGMSRETIAELYQRGVRTVDVSGRGGTNFARIENARRTTAKYDFLEDWGLTTVESLLEAMSLPAKSRPQIIASGGVHHALDVVKCLALGADLVGLSGQALQWVRQPDRLDTAIETVRNIQEQVRDIMTILGAKRIADIQQTDLVLPASAQHWAQARGIDVTAYARRSAKALED
ncbi:type 2 isopentenyl-diphosphate Delta-isomerase [Streptococcus ovuberis]|uniref:Isopentenyl-diphosphate delta-isomerase n=1 Tax=Streptococcus ovuberis TaxID=1936207 RepID=A0A7X6MY68_9STRE|nr:type 2 isopentenyl-diphosphate Delta-isomerase [Streptococcus ovuberis]NKZ20560.1 type 2 isopentenyl-diphosphate Delta-isomerase [Streptococcus ovuberis]